MAFVKAFIRGFTRFRDTYNSWTEAKPLLTHVTTAGTLYFTGDVLCQKLEKKEEWDYMRTARMTVIGIGLMGVAGGKWYAIMDKKLPGTDVRTIVKKVALDQFVFAPAFYLSFYFGMSLLEGHSIQHTYEHVKKKFLPTYAVDLIFWPVAQAVNFRSVSPPNRVLYISSLCIFWNAFLSHFQHTDIHFKLPQFLENKALAAPPVTVTVPVPPKEKQNLPN